MEEVIEKHTQKKRGSLEESWSKNLLEEIACPLCNSLHYRLLYPKYYSRLVKCKCTLIYTNPRLKSGYLQHLYSKEYFQNENSLHFGYENYLSDQPKINKTFEGRLNHIKKFIKTGNLLDIGCATGFFMHVAARQGWNVEGVEISSFAANYARKHFGFKIHQLDIQSFKHTPNSFDIITMWDTIEHFTNPIQVLKKIKLLLNDNGLLVFSTPDASSIPAKLTRHRWVGYKLSDEHLTYFSKKTVSLLCEKAGFRIIKTSYIGKHVSFPMLADRASLYSPLLCNIVKGANKFFPKDFYLYVNPFDIMCVYAKKK